MMRYVMEGVYLVYFGKISKYANINVLKHYVSTQKHTEVYDDYREFFDELGKYK